MKKENLQNKQSGFTLIEAAVVVGLAAVVTSAAFSVARPIVQTARISTTKEREANISQALATFAQNYGRLPCPADSNASANLFGTPVNSGANGMDFATRDCAGTYRGIVPFKALGLSEDQVKDGYGNFLTYAVNRAMTQFNYSNPNTMGLQGACYSTDVWADDSTTPKTVRNRVKAAVCCPLPSLTNLSLVEARGSARPLFNPGPVDNKGENGVESTYPLKVKVVPDQHGWSPSIKESETCQNSLHNYPNSGTKKCYWGSGDNNPMFASSYNPNAVLYSRFHQGDENGYTLYEYVTLKVVQMDGSPIPAGTQADVRLTGHSYEQGFVESNQVNVYKKHKTFYEPVYNPFQAYDMFRTRPNSVMIGRQHKGDENGYTSHRTAYVVIRNNNQDVATTREDVETTRPIKERDGISAYPSSPDKVMVDRVHYRTDDTFESDDFDPGDENDFSAYQFARLEATIQAKRDYTPPKPINRMVAFVLVSHGANGDDAYMKNNQRKQVTVNANAQEIENGVDGNLNFTIRPYSTADGPDYFDDIVTYKTNDQLITQYGNSSCARP